MSHRKSSAPLYPGIVTGRSSKVVMARVVIRGSGGSKDTVTLLWMGKVRA